MMKVFVLSVVAAAAAVVAAAAVMIILPSYIFKDKDLHKVVIIGEVVGTVVSTQKHYKLEGRKLLLIQPLDLEGAVDSRVSSSSFGRCLAVRSSAPARMRAQGPPRGSATISWDSSFSFFPSFSLLLVIAILLTFESKVIVTIF